jgi:shikimate dehydrogenase
VFLFLEGKTPVLMHDTGYIIQPTYQEQHLQTASTPPSPTAGINGATRVVPLLCYPSEHVRTPALFNAYCVAQGLNAVMVPFKVPPAALRTVWEALRLTENIAGLVVTIPHKTEIAALVDTVEGAAAHMGVCNVARRTGDGRFIGRTYDGEGFVGGLLAQGIEVRGRQVALFGAGGAATAIAHELCAQGVQALHVINRTPARAIELARHLGLLYPAVRVQGGQPAPRELDIAINGTALGLHAGDALPFDPAAFSGQTVIADVVMQPDVTPLLERASALGMRIHRGVHMIEMQVALLADFVLGRGH